MKDNRNIDICLTPSIVDLFDLSYKKVVVIDVFRATSAMCVFLNNGGDKVIPVATIEEAIQYKTKHNELHNHKYLVAAERNGVVVPGFDLGNSPLSYHDQQFNNVSLVITTTNGTLAINKAHTAGRGMLLASFLNINAVVSHIVSQEASDVLIVCSGWKGRTCIEDILLAGSLSQILLKNHGFQTDSDAVLLAKNMYNLAHQDLFSFLKNSSYRKRMNLDEDVKYCLQTNIMDIVPVWQKDTMDGGFFFSNRTI